MTTFPVTAFMCFLNILSYKKPIVWMKKIDVNTFKGPVIGSLNPFLHHCVAVAGFLFEDATLFVLKLYYLVISKVEF